MSEAKSGGVELRTVELCGILDVVSDVEITIDANGATVDKTVVDMEEPECRYSVSSTAGTVLAVGEVWADVISVEALEEGLEDCSRESGAVMVV